MSVERSQARQYGAPPRLASVASEAIRHPLLACAGERHVVALATGRQTWHSFGSGPPLVLLHGGHGDWRHWIRNIDALAAGHSVWLPDLPGFGESDDLPGHAHAPDRMERLVGAVLDAMRVLLHAAEPIDVAGFSFGGLVAAALAAQRPVRKLALLGPAGHAGTRRQTRALLDWRALRGEARSAALRQNLAAFMLHQTAAADVDACAIYAEQCERTRFRSRAISRAGGLAQLLEQQQAPVLLLWGEHDVTAQPWQLGPQLMQPGMQRQWQSIADAGHWVQYERAPAVNALLGDWFAPAGA